MEILGIILLVFFGIGIVTWAFELYQKVKDTEYRFEFYCIKIPLIILAIAAIIAIIAVPFYFLGFVDGTVIWTCVIVIVCAAKIGDNNFLIKELRYKLKTNENELRNLSKKCRDIEKQTQYTNRTLETIYYQLKQLIEIPDPDIKWEYPEDEENEEDEEI